MEKSHMLLFRTPGDVANENNHILIFNSPIDYTDQQLIVYQRPGDGLANDAGYCVVFKRDHYIINSPPNYNSPTKRSFLNECIRQLYLINGMAHKLHWEPTHQPWELSSRSELWRRVDMCLQPTELTPKRASLLKVKRQLFRESQRKRKQAQPKRGKIWGTQVLNFKSMRQEIGRRHIRRGYLKLARHHVIGKLIRENLKRELMRTPAVCQNIIGASEGIFNVNASLIGDICSYHNNGAPHQPEVECRLTAGEARLRNNEACRLTHRAKRLEAMFIHEQVRRALQNHQLILEESVRSMFYAKELFRLVEDHEEFVYTDKKILGGGR